MSVPRPAEARQGRARAPQGKKKRRAVPLDPGRGARVAVVFARAARHQRLHLARLASPAAGGARRVRGGRRRMALARGGTTRGARLRAGRGATGRTGVMWRTGSPRRALARANGGAGKNDAPVPHDLGHLHDNTSMAESGKVRLGESRARELRALSGDAARQGGVLWAYTWRVHSFSELEGVWGVGRETFVRLARGRGPVSDVAVSVPGAAPARAAALH